MDTKTSVLKIKKSHATHLFGSKWQSKYFSIDDNRQAIVQRKDSNLDSEVEQIIPFSEIQNITILSDAPGMMRSRSERAMSGNQPSSPSNASTNATSDTSAASSTANGTSTTSNVNGDNATVASVLSTGTGGGGGNTANDPSSRPGRSRTQIFPSFLSAASLRLPSFRSQTMVSTGGGDSSNDKDKKMKTRFVIELKATAKSAVDGDNRVIFEANTAEEAKEWVRILSDKVVTPGFNIVKEDITENIRQFYDIHPKETSLGSRSTVLGAGMSGEVRVIKRLTDGKEFAMKVVNVSQMTPAQLHSLQNEIDILKSLDHPHIAKLYEVYVEHGMCVRLVLELCTGGELFDRLSKKRRFNEHYTALLIQRMLSTICYLHANNIAHRDLKLENWLFRHKDEDDLDIVLIDFGLSHKYRANEHMHALVGTSYYCAPEVLAGDYQGNAEDLWSLGVILYMLLSGSAPFDGPNDEVILDNIRNAKECYPKMANSFWQNVSSEAKDLVRSLLCIDPKERITAEQALKHPWFEVEEANRPPPSIESDVYERLRKFAKFPELKRVAMEVIAFTLDHDEIKNLTETFESLDTDGDGYITFPTIMKTLQEKYKMPEDEARVLFDALDEDKTGRVHANEFVAACLEEKYHQDERYLFDAFIAMDKSNSGYITVDDLRKLLGKSVTPQRAEQLLQEVQLTNRDGDYKVSYQEFLRFMRADAEDDLAETRKRNSKRISKASKTEEAKESKEDSVIVQSAVQEIVQDITSDVVQEAAQEVVQDIVQEVAQEVNQEANQEVIQEAAQEVVQEAAQEVVVEEAIQEVAQDGERE